MSNDFDLKPFMDLANRMADASGDVIRNYFRKPFVVEGKDDSSPVTIADKETEQTLRAILAAERPADGIWGEEFGAEHMEAEFSWVLDPIDGTRAFTCGKPLFGTLIALLHNGVPVLGLIDQPILRERWVGADGIGSFFNGEPCRTRRCNGIEQAVASLSPHPFPDGTAAEAPLYRKIASKVRTTSLGGDCYVYGLLASGHLDLVIENDLKLHDFAALVPIVANAGGVIADWEGKPLRADSSGNLIAAGDARIANPLFGLLAPYNATHFR